MADDLGILLDAQLGRGLADFDPAGEALALVTASIQAVDLIAPGLSRSESLSELASLLAGTDDKRTRKYKSARRQAERWSPSPRARARGVKARTPTLSSRTRLRIARRQQDDRLRSFRLHGGAMKVSVLWYHGGKGRRVEVLPPHYWVHIRQLVMRRVVRLWAAGEKQDAARELFDEFMLQYDIPNPGDWLSDTEIVGLELEPEASHGAGGP
jgi:hypothetical protein